MVFIGQIVLFLLCAVLLYYHDKLSGKFILGSIALMFVTVAFAWQMKYGWLGFHELFYNEMITSLYALVAGAGVGAQFRSRKRET